MNAIQHQLLPGDGGELHTNLPFKHQHVVFTRVIHSEQYGAGGKPLRFSCRNNLMLDVVVARAHQKSIRTSEMIVDPRVC